MKVQLYKNNSDQTICMLLHEKDQGGQDYVAVPCAPIQMTKLDNNFDMKPTLSVDVLHDGGKEFCESLVAGLEELGYIKKDKAHLDDLEMQLKALRRVLNTIRTMLNDDLGEVLGK